MGEFADMMLDGTLCMGCGEFLGEDLPGYCKACAKDRMTSPTKPAKLHRSLAHPGLVFKHVVICPGCQRQFGTEDGARQHYAQKKRTGCEKHQGQE